MTSNLITITGVIKWVAGTGGMFFGFTNYDVWTQTGNLGYNIGASDLYGISSASVSSLGLIGNFTHYAFVMTSTGSVPTNNKIYINGNLQPLSQQLATTSTAPGFSTNLRLSSWNNGGFYGNMQYGNLQVYNRELNQSEIQQNYNATRARFIPVPTPSTFTTQALAWQTAIIANGGSISDATLQTFDDYFFKPMVSANLLDEFDRINIYVGTGDQIAARTSLVSSSTYLVTPVSSPTWANTQGYQSSGTSYLNLNYTPSTQGRKYLQRGATGFYIAKSPNMVTTRVAMGGHTNTTNNTSRNATGGGTFLSSINTSVNGSVVSGQAYTGSVMHMFAMSGSGATNSVRQTIYIPTVGAIISGSGGNITAPSLGAVSQFELTSNNNGTPQGSYETGTYHMTSAHGSFRLYQSGSTVYSILTSLFTQLGV